MDQFLELFLWCIGTLWLLAIIGMIFPKVGHLIFGWHRPTNEINTDGFNFKSRCKICNKEIIQDSQGNWF